VIDPQSLKIVGSVPTQQAESHMLAISPDGRKGYTANVGPGTVSVLDLAGRKTLTVIPVADTYSAFRSHPTAVGCSPQTQRSLGLAVIDTATK